MATHSSILSGEFHGLRNLAGYSLWGHEKSDMDDMTEHSHTHVLIAEMIHGNALKKFTRRRNV